MQSFLSALAEKLFQQYPDGMEAVAVVFPSRRAGTHFRKIFSEMISRPIPAPEILTLEDFISDITGLQPLDNVSMAFEMFPFYKIYFPEDSFDRYYPWGLMMAADFNDADRSCADTKLLFSNLLALHEIDATISTWGSDEKVLSASQQDYLKFWNSLGKMYEGISQKFEGKGFAWPGRMARRAAEIAESENLNLRWKKVFFAGFNAFSIAEERMLLALQEKQIAEMSFDMDRWYTANPGHEAGFFFRRLHQVWKHHAPKGVGDYLGKGNADISVTGVPLAAGQVKAAGMVIREWIAQGIPPEKITVVPGNEKLLFPLLNSLPAEVGHFNVTTSFPALSAPVSGLLLNVCMMHENAAERESEGKQYVYYFRDVRKIISHPDIRSLCPEDSLRLLKIINQENHVFLAPSTFAKMFPDDHPFTLIFKPPDGARRLPGRLRQLLDIPLPGEDVIRKEIAFQLSLLLSRVEARLQEIEEEISFRMVRRLIRDSFSQASVPFSGEPLQGLQIMGLLETRALDPEYLILLSLNEDVLPPSRSFSSFIPQYLRKAFSLPGWEEKDAIPAYHFYRLLQRVKKAHLIYNSQGEGRGGDISRYILQLREEYGKRYPERWSERLLNFKPEKEKAIPISVTKTGKILERMKEHGSESGFSPSALHTWLMCPLRFYYRYVAGLKEPDEVEESPEANTFGEIAHLALKNLYAPFSGKMITSSDFDSLIPKIGPVLEAAFREVSGVQKIDTGKNKLLLQVGMDLVRKVLLTDKENAPFRILALEENFERELIVGGIPIKIRGVLDRVEEADSLVTVVDYKTGKSEAPAVFDTGDFREDPIKYRYPFQLGVYAWLFHPSHKGDIAVKAGVWGLKKISDGMKFLRFGEEEIQEFKKADIAWMGDYLESLISEMLDPATPIEQTEDPDVCQICSFRTLCAR